MAQQPLEDESVLIIEASRSLRRTPQTARQLGSVKLTNKTPNKTPGYLQRPTEHLAICSILILRWRRSMSSSLANSWSPLKAAATAQGHQSVAVLAARSDGWTVSILSDNCRLQHPFGPNVMNVAQSACRRRHRGQHQTVVVNWCKCTIGRSAATQTFITVSEGDK